jgi:hypothetical protein
MKRNLKNNDLLHAASGRPVGKGQRSSAPSNCLVYPTGAIA